MLKKKKKKKKKPFICFGHVGHNFQVLSQTGPKFGVQ